MKVLAVFTSRYRALALQYHPDKNGDEEALELFKQISEAYNVLIDSTFGYWNM